jgi:TetR/AcrR family transcriptional repressor of nem operon
LSPAPTTRDKIIKKGAELIHLKGYNATGLHEILESSGVPKGSFYFYFKSKEDFGIEIIDYFSSLIGGFFTRYLGDKSVPPLRRLERLMEFYESLFNKSGYTLGCPIGNLSLELADINGRFRERINTAVETMLSHIMNCLDEAKRDGSLPPNLEISDTARFIFHGLQGAILHMKVAKSLEPLTTFKRYMLDYLNVGPLHKPRKN